jgi:hypothetical protein
VKSAILDWIDSEERAYVTHDDKLQAIRALVEEVYS